MNTLSIENSTPADLSEALAYIDVLGKSLLGKDRFILALQQTKQDLQEKYVQLKQELSLAHDANAALEQAILDKNAQLSQLQQWKAGVLAEAGRMQEHVHLRLKDFSDESIQNFVDKTNAIVDDYRNRAEHLAAQLLEAHRIRDEITANFNLMRK
jgi:septal ring factor EnvC (AmiA/AmiB activator)